MPTSIQWSQTTSSWMYIIAVSTLCAGRYPCPKDGTNLEFHSNRISNRISSKFRIRIEYRIKYDIQWLQIRLEYWTVSRGLDAVSFRSHGHKSVPESSTSDARWSTRHGSWELSDRKGRPHHREVGDEITLTEICREAGVVSRSISTERYFLSRRAGLRLNDYREQQSNRWPLDHTMTVGQNSKKTRHDKIVTYPAATGAEEGATVTRSIYSRSVSATKFIQ